MTTVAGVVIFKAKPGRGEEVSQRIAEALPAVQKETGTTLWLVLRSSADGDTIFLVDLFDGAPSLDAHMKGDAAKMIFSAIPDLLASEVELHPSQVVASKPAQ